MLTIPEEFRISDVKLVKSETEHTEIRSGPKVDFRVRKDSLCGTLVEAVHYGVACVGGEAGDEEGAFFVVEEAGCFGPVHEPEFCYEAEGDGDDAFDYEDPAPPSVSGDAVHFGDGKGEELV